MQRIVRRPEETRPRDRMLGSIRLLRRNCRRAVQSTTIENPTGAYLALRRARHCAEELSLLVKRQGGGPGVPERFLVILDALRGRLRRAHRSRDTRLLEREVIPALFELEECWMRTCPPMR